MGLPDLPPPVLRAIFDCTTEEDWHSDHFWAVWALNYDGDRERCPEWTAHENELVAAWATDRPGTRPGIWWRLTAPEPRPEGESEVAYLRRHKLLMRGEERRLTGK